MAEKKKSQLESFARGASQGSTMGWGDELSAALGALLATETDKELQRDYSDRYALVRDDIRAQNEAAQVDNPKTYLGGQIAGGVATAAPAGGELLAAKGLSPLAKGGAALMELYGMGAAQGAGETYANDTRGIASAAHEGGMSALTAPYDMSQEAGKALTEGNVGEAGKDATLTALFLSPFLLKGRSVNQFTSKRYVKDLENLANKFESASDVGTANRARAQIADIANEKLPAKVPFGKEGQLSEAQKLQEIAKQKSAEVDSAFSLKYPEGAPQSTSKAAIYPGVGIGTLGEASEKVIEGKPVKVFEFTSADGSKVLLPEEKISLLKPIPTEDEINKALAKLSDTSKVKKVGFFNPELQTQKYLDKIKTGNPEELADVVRQIYRKGNEIRQKGSITPRGVSNATKGIQEKALSQLEMIVSESSGRPLEEVRAEIQKRLSEGLPASKAPLKASAKTLGHSDRIVEDTTKSHKPRNQLNSLMGVPQDVDLKFIKIAMQEPIEKRAPRYSTLLKEGKLQELITELEGIKKVRDLTKQETQFLLDAKKKD